MGFRFCQFEVEDSMSTMRVGTDSMLLGAWSQPSPHASILDIGTGCGVLALMLAQKSIGQIDAVEIDLPSSLEAGENFRNSPWALRLKVVNESVITFAIRTDALYDFIISNPPFFGKSLKSPEPRKNQARHDTSLTHEQLMTAVNKLLAPTGIFTTILPEKSAAGFIHSAHAFQLNLKRSTLIVPRSYLPAKRILLEFSRTAIDTPAKSVLTILNPDGKFSEEYLKLTAEYHQF